MPKRQVQRGLFLSLLIGLTAFGPITTVTAQLSDQDRAQKAVRAGNVLPLREILRIVRKRYAGRVLDVTLSESGKKPSWRYRVKLLGGDGELAVVAVDGRTGRILTPP